MVKCGARVQCKRCLYSSARHAVPLCSSCVKRYALRWFFAIKMQCKPLFRKLFISLLYRKRIPQIDSLECREPGAAVVP